MFNLLFSVYLSCILTNIFFMIINSFIGTFGTALSFYSLFLALFCSVFYYLLTKKLSAFHQIFNILFSLYTGYFLSFFVTTKIFISIQGTKTYFSDGLEYYKPDDLPWIHIHLVGFVIAILTFAILSYSERKKYIKIKLSSYAYTIACILLSIAYAFYSIFSAGCERTDFIRNAHLWILYAFLPSLAYISIYMNKYLAYVLTIVSLCPFGAILILSIIK